MKKDIMKKTRMKNLNDWFSSHPIPEKEKSFISQLKKGTASFGEKVARRLERDYGMPSMFLDNDSYHEVIKSSFIVEVLNITASAGDGFLNSEIQEVIRLIEYEKEQAHILFNGIPSDRIKVINLRGDSMQGTFECGDSVYVDISKQSFDGDGIYVFSFGKGIYIKRLQLIKDVIRVKSDNKLYDPWDITEKEMYMLHIHGKVIFSQSMLLRKHG